MLISILDIIFSYKYILNVLLIYDLSTVSYINFTLDYIVFKILS